MVLVNKLKDKLNYRQDCKKKLADIGGSNKDLELELASVDYECKEMLNTIIEKKKDYLKIDGSYQAEVENYIKGMRTGLCDWLKS